MKEKVSLNHVAIIILWISLSCKFFGFLREILLANFFGTTEVVDVLLMSVTIPSILFGFLPAIGIGFTPIYFEIESDEKRNRFVSNTLWVSTALSILFIIFAILFAEGIVSVCAPGFSDENKKLTVVFLLITIWRILFLTPIQILTAYLNCNSKYVISNLANLFISITEAIFVVLAAKTNVILLPVGIVAPLFIQFVWLYFWAKRNKFTLVRYTKHDEHIKKLLWISLPLFLSTILVDINGFVDKMLSSSLSAGKLSALNYSFTLRAVFVTAAASVISSIVYPRISEKVQQKDFSGMKKTLFKCFDYISFFVIPVMFMCIAFSKELVMMLFMRGRFDSQSVSLTTLPFIMYMFSLAVLIWRDLIVKVMYSFHQTRRYLVFSVIEVGINVCLSFALVKSLEHSGLALGTSVAALICFPLYIFNLCRTLGGFSLHERMNKASKEVIASIVMIVISKIIDNMLCTCLPNTFFLRIVILGVSCCVGVLAYLCVCYLIHVPESKEMITRVFIVLRRDNKK